MYARYTQNMHNLYKTCWRTFVQKHLTLKSTSVNLTPCFLRSDTLWHARETVRLSRTHGRPIHGRSGGQWRVFWESVNKFNSHLADNKNVGTKMFLHRSIKMVKVCFWFKNVTDCSINVWSWIKFLRHFFWRYISSVFGASKIATDMWYSREYSIFQGEQNSPYINVFR